MRKLTNNERFLLIELVEDEIDNRVHFMATDDDPYHIERERTARQLWETLTGRHDPVLEAERMESVLDQLLT